VATNDGEDIDPDETYRHTMGTSSARQQSDESVVQFNDNVKSCSTPGDLASGKWISPHK